MEKQGSQLLPRKRWLYLAVTLTAWLVIAVLVAEIAVRIFFPQSELIKWFRSDKRYGYVNKKNFYQKAYYPGSDFVMEVKTNSLGHRDREYDLSDKNYKRVLLLGDSFTFGYSQNVGDIFDAKLEDLLNQSGKKRWIVLNTGVGGWGTLQETRYARDNFDVFLPDIVIITFCANDPFNDFEYASKVYDLEKGIFYFPGKIFLRDNSHLVRLIVSKNYVLWWNWVIDRKIREGREKGEKVTLDNQSGSAIGESEWDKTLQYIRDFHRDFLKFNPSGVVMVQATEPLNPDIRSHLNTLDNESNLFYIDLYEDMRKLKPGDMCANRVKGDDHWSSLAHTISAGRLYEKIRETEDAGRRIKDA